MYNFVPSTMQLSFEGIVEKCIQRLGSWMKTFDDMAIFKWGVTALPEKRFTNGKYGYITESRWLCMDVVHASDAETCRQL